VICQVGTDFLNITYVSELKCIRRYSAIEEPELFLANRFYLPIYFRFSYLKIYFKTLYNVKLRNIFENRKVGGRMVHAII
jgi:hypothetical protein